MWIRNLFLLVTMCVIASCKNNDDEFRKACASGKVHRVRELINGNVADINKQAKSNGPTPLMLAAQNGHYETVALLIENGARVNIADGAGMTALMLASARQHNKIVELLLNNGANPNIRTVFGKTPLILSVLRDDWDNVELLLRYNADVNIVNDDGQTALDLAQNKLSYDLPNIKKERMLKIINALKAHNAKTTAELREESAEKSEVKKNP